jgi:hypothetical protein
MSFYTILLRALQEKTSDKTVPYCWWGLCKTSSSLLQPLHMYQRRQIGLNWAVQPSFCISAAVAEKQPVFLTTTMLTDFLAFGIAAKVALRYTNF